MGEHSVDSISLWLYTGIKSLCIVMPVEIDEKMYYQKWAWVKGGGVVREHKQIVGIWRLRNQPFIILSLIDHIMVWPPSVC